MKEIHDESIDLIVTDPPYGINFQSNTRLDKKEKIINDDNINYLDFGKECFRVLKNNSHAYFFTRFDVYPQHYQQLKEAGFNIKSVIVSDKLQNTGTGDLKGSFSNNMEWIIFCQKGRRIFNETKLIKNTKKAGTKLNRYATPTTEYKRRLPMLWTVAQGYPPSVLNSASNKDNPHPTPKNIEFLEWLIQLSSNEGDIVLDPFVGSASTILASINTNRKFTGIELDERYYDFSKERVNTYIKDNGLESTYDLIREEESYEDKQNDLMDDMWEQELDTQQDLINSTR